MESLLAAIGFKMAAGATGATGATGAIQNGLTAACGNTCNTGSTLPQILGQVADTLIFLVGAASVIMIIIGGLRYVTSNGDSKGAESGRNTILYAAIGLVVAGASYAIVTFVLKIGAGK